MRRSSDITGELGACPRCGVAHAPAGPCPPAPAPTLALGSELAAGASPPDDDASLVGTRVGSFQVSRLLGRGGMGTVYLGEHPAIGSRVAIKFLHRAMASDARAVTRFYDEARAVNLIGHENIVGVYDLSLLPPDRYYFVMEHLEGETLAARLRRGPLAGDAALDVLLQLCDALQCAHERGVVHRDLKPENVFLVPRRGKAHFVKLLDFGIAKLRVEAAPGGTRDGLIVGTPEYMAPEQCDDGPVDARTDVYALGVMAFQLATGRLPFEARGVAQLLVAQVRTPPPRPSSLAPVAPALEAAILRALEKDPAARFQDMAAFGEALREAGKAAAIPTEVPLTPSVGPAQPARSRGATALATPTPPPAPPPDPLPGLVVELVSAGSARAVPASELTRAGLFLRAEGALPPLLSRVRLRLAHPSLRAPVEVAAEVVRHVAPEDAARFRMAPGFAVQVVEAAPEARAALAALADAAHPSRPAPRPAPRSAASAAARLDALAARAAEGPYALLGLPPDAEFAELRRAGRVLQDELEAARLHPLAPDHPARATALLARVEQALAALGSPASRLRVDAHIGNWRGVLRCLAAGVPDALVAARRQELLRRAPERGASAQRRLARAQVARKLGNAEAARTAWEAALEADPLDRAALEGYVAWQRERGGAPA